MEIKKEMCLSFDTPPCFIYMSSPKIALQQKEQRNG